MKVEQILLSKGTEVYAVAPDDKIADAVALLNEKNIGVVMVKEASGKVAGILSERDIVRRLGRHGSSTLSMRVSECMTPDPVTCGRETTLDALLAKMTDRRIRHMPIVENETLIGLVSIGDVVKRKIDQSEQEAQALKEYIAT